MINYTKTFTYILAILFVVFIGFTLSKQKLQKNTNEEVVCTQEVVQCPDGSFSARIPPTCEFAKCAEPVKEQSASTTKTYVDVKQKISFEYIDNFYLGTNLTEYILPVEWPPEVLVSTEKLTCKSKLKKIGNTSYCLTIESEGAAGSVYTSYTYQAIKDKKAITLKFVTREPQCGNFDDSQKTSCEKEKKEFKIDPIVDKIFETIKVEQ